MASLAGPWEASIRKGASNSGGAVTPLLAAVALAACGPATDPVALARLGVGDPAVGRELVRDVGCGACHEIPGLVGPRGRVGPPLAGFARRALIAGRIPNRPAELARWVRDAPAFDPDTGMPPMPLTPDEARHVAAYLYTLDHG
jgi:mono/diheme cytochrome c family protein